MREREARFFVGRRGVDLDGLRGFAGVDSDAFVALGARGEVNADFTTRVVLEGSMVCDETTLELGTSAGANDRCAAIGVISDLGSLIIDGRLGSFFVISDLNLGDTRRFACVGGRVSLDVGEMMAL